MPAGKKLWTPQRRRLDKVIVVAPLFGFPEILVAIFRPPVFFVACTTIPRQTTDQNQSNNRDDNTNQDFHKVLPLSD